MAIENKDWPFLAGIGIGGVLVGAFGSWVLSPSDRQTKPRGPGYLSVCSQTGIALANALSKWLMRQDEEGPLKILLKEEMRSWTRGGCWLLGAALQKWLGPKARLWAVYRHLPALNEDRVDHIALKVGDCFIDGDGIWTAEELIENTQGYYTAYQTEADLWIGEFDERLVGKILCRPSAVRKLAKGLEAEFGDGGPIAMVLFPEQDL